MTVTAAIKQTEVVLSVGDKAFRPMRWHPHYTRCLSLYEVTLLCILVAEQVVTSEEVATLMRCSRSTSQTLLNGFMARGFVTRQGKGDSKASPYQWSPTHKALRWVIEVIDDDGSMIDAVTQ